MRGCATLIRGFVILSAGCVAGAAHGAEPADAEAAAFVPLVEGKPYIHVIHEGRAVKVQRVQNPGYQLRGYFARTVRECPPFCIRPQQVDPRVETVAEVEMFAFMETELRDGNGLLIDARTPPWFGKGTIPGSINVPFTELVKTADDPGLARWLGEFGAEPREEPGFLAGLLERWGWVDPGQKTDRWDFSGAKHLVLWCNGPTCGQSPRAIEGLLRAGYPPAKLRYYRGGMQMWQLFGLTTVIPSGIDAAGTGPGAAAAE